MASPEARKIIQECCDELGQLIASGDPEEYNLEKFPTITIFESQLCPNNTKEERINLLALYHSLHSAPGQFINAYEWLKLATRVSQDLFEMPSVADNARSVFDVVKAYLPPPLQNVTFPPNTPSAVSDNTTNTHQIEEVKLISECCEELEELKKEDKEEYLAERMSTVKAFAARIFSIDISRVGELSLFAEVHKRGHLTDEEWLTEAESVVAQIFPPDSTDGNEENRLDNLRHLLPVGMVAALKAKFQLPKIDLQALKNQFAEDYTKAKSGEDIVGVCGKHLQQIVDIQKTYKLPNDIVLDLRKTTQFLFAKNARQNHITIVKFKKFAQTLFQGEEFDGAVANFKSTVDSYVSPNNDRMSSILGGSKIFSDVSGIDESTLVVTPAAPTPGTTAPPTTVTPATTTPAASTTPAITTPITTAPTNVTPTRTPASDHPLAKPSPTTPFPIQPQQHTNSAVSPAHPSRELQSPTPQPSVASLDLALAVELMKAVNGEQKAVSPNAGSPPVLAEHRTPQPQPAPTPKVGVPIPPNIGGTYRIPSQRSRRTIIDFHVLIPFWTDAPVEFHVCGERGLGSWKDTIPLVQSSVVVNYYHRQVELTSDHFVSATLEYKYLLIDRVNNQEQWEKRGNRRVYVFSEDTTEVFDVIDNFDAPTRTSTVWSKLTSFVHTNFVAPLNYRNIEDRFSEFMLGIIWEMMSAPAEAVTVTTINAKWHALKVVQPSPTSLEKIMHEMGNMRKRINIIMDPNVPPVELLVGVCVFMKMYEICTNSRDNSMILANVELIVFVVQLLYQPFYTNQFVRSVTPTEACGLVAAMNFFAEKLFNSGNPSFLVVIPLLNLMNIVCPRLSYVPYPLSNQTITKSIALNEETFVRLYNILYTSDLLRCDLYLAPRQYMLDHLLILHAPSLPVLYNITKQLYVLHPTRWAACELKIRDHVAAIARSTTSVDVLMAASEFHLSPPGEAVVRAMDLPFMREIFEDCASSIIAKILSENAPDTEARVFGVLKQLPNVASSDRIINTLISSKTLSNLPLLVSLLELCVRSGVHIQNGEMLGKIQTALVKAVNNAFANKEPLPNILQACTRLFTSQLVTVEELRKHVHSNLMRLSEEEIIVSVCSLHEVEHIHVFFLDAVRQLAVDSVSSMCTTPHDHLHLFSIINKLLSASSYTNSFCYSLLDAARLSAPVSSANTSMQDKLQHILPLVNHWKLLFMIKDNMQVRNGDEKLPEKVFADLPDVEMMLREAAQSVLTHQIKCVVLQVLLNYKNPFLDICAALRFPEAVPAKLRQCEEIYNTVSHQRAVLATFFDHYCAPLMGGSVASPLQHLHVSLKNIREQYEDTSIVKLQENLAACYPAGLEAELTALDQLKSNNLFLSIWKDQVRQHLRTGSELKKSAGLDEDEGEADAVVGDDDVPPSDSVKSNSLDEIKLLVGRVFEKCAALYDSIHNSSIRLADLDTLAKGMNSFEELASDLAAIKIALIYVRTGKIDESQQSNIVRANLNNYSSILHQKQLTASVLDSLEILKLYSSMSEDWIESIRNVHYSLSDGWVAANLNAMYLVVQGVNLFPNVPKDQVQLFEEFFAELAKSGEFIKLLHSLASREKENVADLIDLCKNNTDKDTELKALTNFRDARLTILKLAMLHQQQIKVQLNWETILDIINKECNITANTIQTLKGVNSHISELNRIFTDVGKNASTRAISDLKQIIQHGVFVFSNPNVMSLANISEVATHCLSVKLIGAHKLQRRTDFSFDELEQLRNRLMLASGTNSDDTRAIDEFVDQFQVLREVNQTMVALHLSGHPSFQVYSHNINANTCSIEELVRFREDKLTERNEWEGAVQTLRKHYYFLNFFTIRQMLSMRDLTVDTKLTNQLFDWLRFVKLDLDFDLVKSELEKFKTLPRPPHVVKHEHTQIFEEIGSVLACVFKTSSECNRQISNLNPEEGDFVVGEPNLVIAANEEVVLATSLSIYAKLGRRIPEAEELLVCNDTTTEELIRLFLMRCLGAAKQGRASRIYCLASIELLSFELQVSIHRIWGELLDSKTGVYRENNKYKLIIVSGKAEKQQVVTDFGKYTRERLRSLLQDDIQKLLLKYFGLENIRVHVFLSRFAGQGKTKYIQDWCAQEGFKSPKVVPILSPLSAEEFVGVLLKAQDPQPQQDERKLQAFHLDMSPTVTSSMSALLFQLLVTGCLMRSNGEIYHRPRNMAFILEIPNSINDEAHKRLYFADLLPFTLVDQSNNPLAVTSKSDLVLRNYRTENAEEQQNVIQYVCKYLSALKTGKIPVMDVHPHSLPDMTLDACVESLRAYCPNWNESTLVLQMNFVNYLFQQFRKFEENDFLVVAAVDDPTLRPSIVQWIINTSVDFASSSMKPFEERGYDDLGEHFKLTRKWSESSHPLLLFNNDEGTVTPLWEDPLQTANFDLLRQLCLVCHKYATRQDAPLHNDVCGVPALQHFTEELGVRLLATLFNVGAYIIVSASDSSITRSKYVLTKDNFLKIVAIQFRIQSGIPVLIMGETGCGKTRLIEFMADCQGIPLKKRNVDGGVTMQIIEQDVLEMIEKANADPEHRFYLFFDEINTSNIMGLFKEILCDHRMNGKILPQNLIIIAACNPYRRIKRPPQAGLVYRFSDSSINVMVKKEDMQFLAYLVFPLPETMKQYVWDFGSLDAPAQLGYIRSIIATISIKDNGARYSQFCTAVYESQLYLQKYEQEASAVSLREVSRCTKLYEWFVDFLNMKRIYAEKQRTSNEESFLNAEVYKSKKPKKEKRDDPDVLCVKALFLSLALCYYFRLSLDARVEYAKKMNGIIKGHKMEKILEEEEAWFLTNFEVPPGTAKNQALLENTFVLLVCIFNKIPVFLVGKPGSSKTLAVNLIKYNFAQERKKDCFAMFPAIDIISHQCSPQTTSKGIEESYQRACRNKDAGDKITSVLLLDEVGLAEQSPHLPLKVLHRLFDSVEVAIVGISNWTLDSAKMNRAIHLHRPPPEIDDLHYTVRQMLVAQGNNNMLLSNLLSSLAKAYDTVYRSQTGKDSAKKEDFYGLRDFYALVRDLNTLLSSSAGRKKIKDYELLLRAVSHNFNGLGTEEFVRIFKIFLEHTKIDSSITQIQPLDSLTVIKENLENPQARHLMVITKNDAALQILLDQGIISHANTKILFGSDYPNDMNDSYVCRMIQHIRTCMEKGDRIVLLYQDNLYESLYDLLNQNYVTIGNTKYCWMALGANSRQCIVHDDFKCIVIVDKEDALSPSGLPPPLLNRFVKQTLMRSDIINLTGTEGEVTFIKKWMSTISSPYGVEASFIGYHPSFVESLVVATVMFLRQHRKSDEPPQEEDLVLWGKTVNHEAIRKMALKRALLSATPETLLRAEENTTIKSLDKLKQFYFAQEHTNLPRLVDWGLQRGIKTGLQFVAITYAARLRNYTSVLTKCESEAIGGVSSERRVQEVHLSNMTSEHELLHKIRDFFWSPEKAACVLLVICDTRACSLQRLHHFKFLCSRERAEFARVDVEFHRHVVIVCHIPRPQSGSITQNPIQQPQNKSKKNTNNNDNVSEIVASCLVFQYDAENQWRHVYIDELESGTESGIPEITDMLGTSLREILMQERVLKELLPMIIQREYRSSLHQLQYPDTKAQIEIMNQLLKDNTFIVALIGRLTSLIDEDALIPGSTTSWQARIASNKRSELNKEGSLRAAMYRYVVNCVTKALSILLSSIDYNANLSICANNLPNSPIVHLWYDLFSSATLWHGDIPVPKSSLTNTLGVNRGAVQAFKAQFPFSSVIYSAVEALRLDAESLAGERTVPQQVHSLMQNGRLLRVALLDEDLMQLYMRDFLEMLPTYGLPVAEAKMAQTLVHLLIEASMKEHQQIWSIHATYWQLEPFLNSLFSIFRQIQAPTHRGIVELLADRIDNPREIQLVIVQDVIESLKPEKFSKNHNKKWIELFSNVYNSMVALFKHFNPDVPPEKSPPKDAEEGEASGSEEEVKVLAIEADVLWHSWIQLYLYREFVVQIGEPLELPEPVYEAFWRFVVKDLRTREIACSREGLNSLITFLRKQIPFGQDERQHWSCINKFLEEYLIGICFKVLPNSDHFQALPPLFLDIILRAACDQSESFARLDILNPIEATNDICFGYSLRRTCFTQLLQAEGLDKWGKSGARAMINEHLSSIVKECGIEDIPLCVLYVETYEDWLSELAKQTKAVRTPPAAEIIEGMLSKSLINKLEAISEAKYLLSKYAKQLSLFAENRATKIDPQLAESVNLLFAKLPKNQHMPPHVIFLLKLLVQANGVQRTAVLLNIAHVTEAAPWIKSTGVNGLLKVNSSRVANVPSIEPHAIFNTSYLPIRNAVRHGLVIGNVEGLDALLKKLKGVPEHEISSAKQAIFTSLFEEVITTYASGVKVSSGTLDSFFKDLKKTPFMDSHEREIVTCFLNNKSAIPEFRASPVSPHSNMTIFSVLAHLAGVACAEPEKLVVFRQLMISPHTQQDVFLPTMPDDHRMHIAREYLKTFRDHGIYLSPRNHLYTVPPCGLPMSVEKCGVGGCDEDVGGTNHVPIAGHIRIVDPAVAVQLHGYKITVKNYLDLTELTPKGYLSSDQENRANYTVRDLSQACFHVLRFLVNGALTLSTIINFANQTKTKALNIVTPPTKDESFFFKELVGEWSHLRDHVLNMNEEDLMITFHLMINALSQGAKHNIGVLNNVDKRHAWEKWATLLIQPILDDLPASLTRFKTRYQVFNKQNSDIDFEFLSELQETVPPEKTQKDVEYRKLMVGGLYRLRNTICITGFIQKLVGNAELMASHPILAMLLTEDEEIQALKYLPGIIWWKQLMHARFNKRVDKETARNLRVADVLKILPDPELHSSATAFKEFRLGWNISRKFVGKQSEDIQATLVEMTPGTSILYSFDSPIGEGSQGVALVRYLVEKQNSIILRARRILGRKIDLNNAPAGADEIDDLYQQELHKCGLVNMHSLLPTHVLDCCLKVDNEKEIIENRDMYSKTAALFSFIQQASHTSYLYGHGKSITFDYGRIEDYIVKHYLSGLPTINPDRAHFRMLNFINETNVNDTRARVAKKIPQEELSKELKDRILKELNSAENTQRCLRSVEICMNFLKSSGGSGELQITKYAMEVLQLNCADPHNGFNFPFLQNEGSEVLLKHVNGLWETLYHSLNPNPMAALNPKYRIVLKQPLLQDVEKFFGLLERDSQREFLGTLKQFILDNLPEELIDSAASIKQYIAPMLTNEKYREGFGLPPLTENILRGFINNIAHFPAEVSVKFSHHMLEYLTKKVKK